MLRDEKYYINLNSRLLNQFEKREGYSKKRKDISGLIRISLICLKASVYAQDKLSKNEGFVI